MKNTKSLVQFLVLSAVAIVIVSLSSCSSGKIVPSAVNTVNSVRLSELNLMRKDYKVLKTISAEAVVKVEFNMTSRVVSEENEEFVLKYKKTSTGKEKGLEKFRGIMKFGYLSNGYDREDLNTITPEEIAIRTAKYRLINLAKQMGADGIVEPIISTNTEQIGDDIVIKTTASGKPIVLKND